MNKEYVFKVNFYNTYGNLYVEAGNYADAYKTAMDEIGNALCNLPVEVEFDVDCIEEPEEDEEDDE